MARFSVLLMLLSFSAGCSCDLILYQGALEVMFEPAISVPGVVEIELSGDLDTLCIFALPLEPDDLTVCVEAEVDTAAPLDFHVLPTEDGLSAAGLHFSAVTPARFGLIVRHEGEVLYDGEQEPEYTSTDHGRGHCKQTTQSAVVEIEVPEPQG